MRINEIYQSIQGESTYAGLPCVFVRTTGCHLRCRWCDTGYAFEEGVSKSIDDILEEVHHFHCNLVELTGGEPLLQEQSFTLVRALLDEGYTVLIETSGAISIDPVDSRAVIILDVKCPGSEMSDRMHWDNLNLLKKNDEVKFVIADLSDYDWAKQVIETRPVLKRKTIHFSPVFGEMDSRQLADWILRDHLPVRLQLQLHKHIWDPSMKGV